MRRVLVQFEEATCEELRRRAFGERRSVAAVVRELVAAGLAPAPAGRRGRATPGFASVAAGRSRQGRLAPVSERHDEALAEALAGARRR